MLILFNLAGLAVILWALWLMVPALFTLLTGITEDGWNPWLMLIGWATLWLGWLVFKTILAALT